MKKLAALFLVLALLLGCACAETAEEVPAKNYYDKDISFGDYTFGMTFPEANKVAGFSAVLIQDVVPHTSRVIADPAYETAARWTFWQLKSFCPSFTAYAPEKQVAGHEASVTLYFRFPGAAEAADFNLGSSLLYAGTYEFYDLDGNTPYDDLKAKLVSLYGTPYAETENANEIWGDVMYYDLSEGFDPYMDALQNITNVKYAVWQSSSNHVMVVLSTYNDAGWVRTQLSYIDSSAEDPLLEMLSDETPAAANDDVSGL